MSSPTTGSSRSAARHPLRALVLLLTLVAVVLPWSGVAQAHGTIVGPATRQYQCWQAWGSNHTNPAMQQQDPCVTRRSRRTRTPCGTG